MCMCAASVLVYRILRSSTCLAICKDGSVVAFAKAPQHLADHIIKQLMLRRSAGRIISG